MTFNLRKTLIFAFNAVIFFLFSILHYSTAFNFKLFNVNLILIIPLLTAFSLWHSPLCSAVTGVLCGIIMDAFASNTYCFNAIILLITATAVSVTSSTLFNKNLPSAMVLSLLSCFIYFISHWAIFHTFTDGITNSLTFLLKISFPSCILTALFIFPFYFLYKHIEKLKLK